MRIGITYDTGIFPGTRVSRPVFTAARVEEDMRVIARELKCAAVRITGGLPERIQVAAEFAAREGMEVWFSPFPCEMDGVEMLAMFRDCAARAEALRVSGAGVVLVLGCEVSVFGKGLLPGADCYARMQQLAAPSPEVMAEYGQILARFNGFLGAAAQAARVSFGGPLTYASGLWEQVDWAPFDFVGADAYRDGANAAGFEQVVAGLGVHGKPVAVTEFGCCTFRGAAELGAMGWTVSDGVRDEAVQVDYLREVSAIYRRGGVDVAFWFTFASWNRTGADSFGVVDVVDGESWRPKAVFGALGG